MLHVLVVGQTPPPHHGQAVMIERLLAGRFERIVVHHVRMRFSKTMDEVGRFRPGKLLGLVGLITRIVAARVRFRTPVLYYPPGGLTRMAIYRDLGVLLATRWLFRRIVFHFHAGGLTDRVERLTRPERLLCRVAYGCPDLAIRVADQTPPDAARVSAAEERVIPNGIDDVFPDYEPLLARARSVPVVLYIGMLSEEKGLLTLLAACLRLHARGIPFSLRLVGAFVSREVEARTRQAVADGELQERVVILGIRTGDAKWRELVGADVFCYPTAYDAEGLPLAVLEAMQFRLPVVASRWRGIQSLVREGETGFLVEPNDPEILADRLGRCLDEPELRRRMGVAGREMFRAAFTVEEWWRKMEQALLVADPSRPKGLPGHAPAGQWPSSRWSG